jgi:hypothetical protein
LAARGVKGGVAWERRNGRSVRVPCMRSLLDWLDSWRVEDQIAFSGDIEFDEKTGKLIRKSSGLPPEHSSDDGA